MLVAEYVDMDLLTSVIDLDAIAHNTRLLKRHAGSAQLMGVLKADGYNHGALEVARVMAGAGADQFGVATLGEALALRGGGVDKPILAWIWDAAADLNPVLDAGIELGLPSIAHVERVCALGRPARVSLKLDTGLGRSGLVEDDWGKAFTLLRDAPNLNLTGLFTHFACADEVENPHNNLQIERFRKAIRRAREFGLEVPINHMANSAGLLMHPDSHFQLVRPGIALYGLSPIAGQQFDLRPAMSWIARVTVVKKLRAGEGVSYGLSWHAPEDGFVAIVPCGYADGLPRALQEKITVVINGRPYPQVGRVCMDQIVVWLDKDTVPQGAQAILFGPGHNGEMTADTIATALGTINYEVVCSPRGRTNRTYIGGAL